MGDADVKGEEKAENVRTLLVMAMTVVKSCGEVTVPGFGIVFYIGDFMYNGKSYAVGTICF